jgi:hypothetical protein
LDGHPVSTDILRIRVGKARALGADIVQELFVNPNPRHLECSVRDPDGYVVVLAGRNGDAG